MDTRTKFYALKIIQIRKLLDVDFHPRKSIDNQVFQLLAKCQFSIAINDDQPVTLQLLSGLPNFDPELIHLWDKICDTEPPQASEILAQSFFAIMRVVYAMCFNFM